MQAMRPCKPGPGLDACSSGRVGTAPSPCSKGAWRVNRALPAIRRRDIGCSAISQQQDPRPLPTLMLASSPAADTCSSSGSSIGGAAAVASRRVLLGSLALAGSGAPAWPAAALKTVCIVMCNLGRLHGCDHGSAQCMRVARNSHTLALHTALHTHGAHAGTCHMVALTRKTHTHTRVQDTHTHTQVGNCDRGLTGLHLWAFYSSTWV